MVDTEHVLVDGAGLSPLRIAERLAELLDDLLLDWLTDHTMVILPKGAWCDVDGWQPFDDTPESGAGFAWDISVNGGGWRDTVELTREVFDRLCAGTDWRLALYVEAEIVERRIGEPGPSLRDQDSAELDYLEHGEPVRTDSVITRGCADAVVVAVRMNPDEAEELERYADGRELPVSTVARAFILTGLRRADKHRQGTTT